MMPRRRLASRPRTEREPRGHGGQARQAAGRQRQTLRQFARFNFNGFGNPHGGLCNFRDSRCDESAELIVMCRCHSTRNTRCCLNKKCLFHGKFPTFYELNMRFARSPYGLRRPRRPWTRSVGPAVIIGQFTWWHPVRRRGSPYRDCSTASTAARASRRVESRAGNGQSSVRTSRGISVQPNITLSQPRSFIRLITSL